MEVGMREAEAKDTKAGAKEAKNEVEVEVGGSQGYNKETYATDASTGGLVTGCYDPREVCILHFVNCGLPEYRAKYELLGDFPDRWFGGRTPIPLPFHKRSRDIIMQNTVSAGESPAHGDGGALADGETPLDAVAQFYRDTIALTDTEVVCAQLESGVCVRHYTSLSSR
jgi:hypothetical protein